MKKFFNKVGDFFKKVGTAIKGVFVKKKPEESTKVETE